MRRFWFAFVIETVVCSIFLIAQKTPSPPPRAPNPVGTSPMPMPNLNPDPYGLQRMIDLERMSTPEPTAKPVGILELEKTLDANRNSGDAKLAALLSGLTLTERASAARQSRWHAEFSGARTRQTLTALEDESTFQALPTPDIPDASTPTRSEQQRMVSEVGKYISSALPALPNFRAVRSTTYFEDHPPRELPLATDPVAASAFLNRPMHVVGTSKSQVAYVDGHEVTEKQSGIQDMNPEASRFTTAGEFGPILYGVMMDAARSKLVWGGWEQGAGGLLAVFRFDAPKASSHYAVKPPGSAKPGDNFVAYRGEIAVDPSDGTILRLSVMAQPAPDDSLAVANIVVEYGRVNIGKHMYTCPVHGVALSKVPLHAVPSSKRGGAVPLQTQLNDVVFEQYHVFRGDLKVQPDEVRQP